MISNLMNIYGKNGLFTKVHIWIRFKTCPFLEIEKFIPKKGIIIDYGCGHGIFSHILAMLSHEREIYGVDISKQKIKEAQRTLNNNKNIRFLYEANQEHLIKNADCVVLLDVLCYLKNNEREDLLNKIYKTLRPGAKIIIKDLNKSFSVRYALLYLQEFIVVRLLRITEADCLNFFNIKYLHSILKNIGFDVQVVYMSRHYWYPHVSFICKKTN